MMPRRSLLSQDQALSCIIQEPEREEDINIFLYISRFFSVIDACHSKFERVLGRSYKREREGDGTFLFSPFPNWKRSISTLLSLSLCRSLNRVRRVLCAVKGGREDGCADGHPALAWGREGSRGEIHRLCEKGTFRRRRNI